MLATRVKLCIEYAKAVIIRRLSEIGKSKEEIQAENNKKIEYFVQGTIELNDKISDLKKYLKDKEEEIYFAAKAKSKECAKQIRAEIYKVIEGGVFDGEYLSTAFNEIQEDKTMDFADSIIKLLMNIKFEVEGKFDEIKQIEIENEINISPESFQSNSSFKWEKGVQFGANLGGAILGATMAKGAATLITGLLFGAASNPAGWVVAGVGVAIYGLMSLAGWGVKKMTQ